MVMLNAGDRVTQGKGATQEMIDPHTGYNDAIDCECRYDSAHDRMDRDDCGVHAEEEVASVPCSVSSTDAGRRPPRYVSIGNGLYVRSGRVA